MDALSVNINDIKWIPAEEYPAGTEKKVLSAGDSTSPRTILLKLPPGWLMDSHSHRFTELHYILEGEYESQGKKYSSGTFRLIPGEVEHGPFSTKSGAIIMVVWCTLAE